MTGAHDEPSVSFDERRPEETAITPNELAWISFIRIASCDSDPPPTLKRVQTLRRLLQDQDP